MYSKFFKRLLDFILALILFPFFLIFLLMISPLIYIEDKGPFFFYQERRGKNGKVFNIIKFRTMKVNAPDERLSDGSTFNSQNDPRVTKIGKFLRQSSLDETPQLINILLGHMSFIGPRPTLATLDYNSYSAIKKKRLMVRPGLTGYSQAYFRNSIKAEEKFKYDCYYVDNIGFCTDIRSVLRTLNIVLRRKDIYLNE